MSQLPEREIEPKAPERQVHWIKPTVPTVLGDRESLSISGTDLVFASLDGGWFFPGPLDFKKLKQAYADALHDYPHAAGRLRCDPETGKWRIALTNSAIPITVHRTAVDPRPEVEFMHERHPDFLDQLPWGFAPVKNNDEPLVRCMLTYWEATGEWSHSMSWCHLLGDGLSLWRFLDTLHRHYMGLAPRFMPTFEKYTNSPPVLERTALLDTIPLVPHLAIDYAPGDFFTMYSNMLESTSRIDLQFTLEQLKKMRSVAEKSSGVKISTQDALTAYLVTALNRVDDIAARWIMNVVDYRGVPAVPGSSYTPPPLTSAGNITVTRFSDNIPAEAKVDIGGIAAIVRDTLERARDPDFVRRTAAISEELYTRSSNANRCQWWFPWDDGVAVNNLYRVPWTGPHFGYPGKNRFHVYDSWERYLRIWPGNPTKNEKGEWQANTGSARVFFRVKHHLKDKLLKVVAQDMEQMELASGAKM